MSHSRSNKKRNANKDSSRYSRILANNRNMHKMNGRAQGSGQGFWLGSMPVRHLSPRRCLDECATFVENTFQDATSSIKNLCGATKCPSEPWGSHDRSFRNQTECDSILRSQSFKKLYAKLKQQTPNTPTCADCFDSKLSCIWTCRACN